MRQCLDLFLRLVRCLHHGDPLPEESFSCQELHLRWEWIIICYVFSFCIDKVPKWWGWPWLAQRVQWLMSHSWCDVLFWKEKAGWAQCQTDDLLSEGKGQTETAEEVEPCLVAPHSRSCLTLSSILNCVRSNTRYFKSCLAYVIHACCSLLPCCAFLTRQDKLCNAQGMQEDMASNRFETQWAKNLASYVNERPLHHMSHRAGVSLGCEGSQVLIV